MENKKNNTTNNKRYLEEALQEAKAHIKKDPINGYAYAFGMLNSAILSFLGKEDELKQELGLEPANNGYIVKLTQKNTKDGTTQYFYLGTDGYTHSKPTLVIPFKKKGNALNLIKRETQTNEFYGILRVSENSCIEYHHWLNVYEVIPA